MSSNLVHNILNAALIVVGAAGAVLLYLGCTIDDLGVYDCSGAAINPSVLSIVALGIGTAKIIINVVRDGLTGLAKEQPPVQ